MKYILGVFALYVIIGGIWLALEVSKAEVEED